MISSVVIRAQTGAIGMNGYSAPRKLATTGDCNCGGGMETVKAPSAELSTVQSFEKRGLGLTPTERY